MTNQIKTPPAPLATVTVTTNSGPVTVPCEPVTDQIVITPVFEMDDQGKTCLTGDFTVTHRSSGRTIADGSGCIECCRWSARMLASTSIDWSLLTPDNTAEISRGWSVEDKTTVSHARALSWICDAECCARREVAAEVERQVAS